MKSYSFSVFNKYCENGISNAISDLNINTLKPIIVCIGSDLLIGDSLGPLVGTLLKQKGACAYVYGTLNTPITAKEVEYARTYLREFHKNTLLIAVDAAIGKDEDVGLIKVNEKGLKPGLGVNKNMKEIGDISIIGIVAGKSYKNNNLFNLTRLNLIYKMANAISNGIYNYINNRKNLLDVNAV